MKTEGLGIISKIDIKHEFKTEERVRIFLIVLRSRRNKRRGQGEKCRGTI